MRQDGPAAAAFRSVASSSKSFPELRVGVGSGAFTELHRGKGLFQSCK